MTFEDLQDVSGKLEPGILLLAAKGNVVSSSGSFSESSVGEIATIMGIMHQAINKTIASVPADIGRHYGAGSKEEFLAAVRRAAAAPESQESTFRTLLVE